MRTQECHDNKASSQQENQISIINQGSAGPSNQEVQNAPTQIVDLLQKISDFQIQGNTGQELLFIEEKFKIILQLIGKSTLEDFKDILLTKEKYIRNLADIIKQYHDKLSLNKNQNLDNLYDVIEKNAFEKDLNSIELNAAKELLEYIYNIRNTEYRKFPDKKLKKRKKTKSFSCIDLEHNQSSDFDSDNNKKESNATNITKFKTAILHKSNTLTTIFLWSMSYSVVLAAIVVPNKLNYKENSNFCFACRTNNSSWLDKYGRNDLYINVHSFFSVIIIFWLIAAIITILLRMYYFPEEENNLKNSTNLKSIHASNIKIKSNKDYKPKSNSSKSNNNSEDGQNIDIVPLISYKKENTDNAAEVIEMVQI